MEDLYDIYLITNIQTNQNYIGQAAHRRGGYIDRWKEHLRYACYLIENDIKVSNDSLHSAMKVYGIENFTLTLIEKDIPEIHIDEKECYYISLYKSFWEDGGYNLTRGGQGIHGYKHTEDTLSKISESSKLKWQEWKSNPEFLMKRNSKISDKLKGRKFTEEHKSKLSEIAKTKIKEKNPFYGKHHTEESKAKMRLDRGFPVKMCDKESGEVLRIFDSVMDAARYLLEQGITSNKTCFTRIFEVLYKKKGQGKTAYGFKWEFVE